MNLTRRIAVALTLLYLAGCAKQEAPAPAAPKASITKEAFGKIADGTAVDIYTLTNKGGLEARIITYGGRIVSLKTPDRTGKMADIVLGFDTLDGYLKENPFFGALVGRYGNRIGRAKFSLNGTEYKLAVNNGANHLHGGIKGFDKMVWGAKEIFGEGMVGLELTYLSKDGEENYPGNLQTKVTYTLNDANELKVAYDATTDKDTVVNLTNHTYFNLAGAGEGDILGTQLMLNASKFTPVDKGLIPTGVLQPVKGTPFDFTKATAIGARINDEKDQQIKFGGGYDHNFVLDKDAGGLTKAAEAFDAKTGRVMELFTTEPGVQFYTSNFLDGSLTGKGGKVYNKRYAFCLETQHYPDSPNKPNFPTTVVKAGGHYQTETMWKFSAR